MPIGTWLQIALAGVVGVVGLVVLARWPGIGPAGDYLGVAVFAAGVGYAMWLVRRYFDWRERGGEGER